MTSPCADIHANQSGQLVLIQQSPAQMQAPTSKAQHSKECPKKSSFSRDLPDLLAAEADVSIQFMGLARNTHRRELSEVYTSLLKDLCALFSSISHG